MTAYRFVTADVFTDRAFGGNPLAVFPDGRGLDTETMQRVAREFNLSETVFVLPPDNPDHCRKLRIFTPQSELPFAGHPTVGAAHVLAAIGDIALDGDTTRVVFEEGVGPVPVVIKAADREPVFAELSVAHPPERGPDPPTAFVIAGMLSLQLTDLAEAPQSWSCGMPFTFVPLKSLNAVRRARLKREVWEGVLADFWAPSVFVFSRETEQSGSDLHGRMFAPGVGVTEDPATGSAVAALAGLLGTSEQGAECTFRWVVEQGFEMGRPSFLHLEADKENGAVAAVRVGGASVLISRGDMDIPTP